MDDHFCPMCGEQHGHVSEPEAEAEAIGELSSAEVEIARINADRDIKLARISAGMVDAEQVAELAHAEGVAEGMEAVVEAGTPEPAPAPEPEPIPVPMPEPEPEPEAPPVAEEHHEKKPSAPKGFFG